MNEKVEIVFVDEHEQKDCSHCMYEPALLVDVDEECSSLTEFLPELKSLYKADPFSIFINIARDSHSLEQFTVMLMDSMDLFETESQKCLYELSENPKFLVLSSYVEMVATTFPLNEKVIKTLKTMIDATEIKENMLNAIDLMFGDLEQEASESNRAVYQYRRFCQFPLEDRQEAISVLAKAFESNYPDKVSEKFTYLDGMPFIAYLPYCQSNKLQVLKRNVLIYCMEIGILDRKAILRVNGGCSDVLPLLIGEENYIENEVTIITPSFQKLIETMSKSKMKKECRTLKAQWKEENKHENK